MTRVLAREPAAIDQFARRLDVVQRFLTSLNARHRRPLDEHALADVAQDTAVLAWRSLASYRGEGALETWLYGLARFQLANAHRMFIRRTHRYTSLEDVDEGSRPSASDPRDPEYEDLHRALARLPAESATVLRLRHFDSAGFEEIATVLEVPVNTAKTRYYRALVRLEEVLRGQHTLGAEEGGRACTTTRRTTQS